MRLVGAMACALALSVTAASAQAPVAPAKPLVSSWFGVPSPGPVTSPDSRTYEAKDNAYGAFPASFKKPRDPKGVFAGDKMMADVNTIVGFSRARRDAGDALWGRISGLPGERAAVEWAVGRLKAAGYENARAEEYVVERPVYLPKKWEVRILGDASFGAGTRDVVLQSSFPTPLAKTTAKAVEAPLVFVGRGSAAELSNIDVKGKIGVVNVVPNDSLFAAREKGVARALAARGAVGVINAVESPGNLHFYDSRYGCADGPCFLVGGDDGAFLESVIGRAAAAKKTVKARLSVESEVKEGLKALNGYAVMPGKSDEVIIVNAHADAWFDGADDNADGLAVQMALAEHFATRKMNRTLVFMISGGHHTGNGPGAFIAAHPEIMDKTVMVINLEHVAQIAVGQESRLDPGTDNYASGLWSASTTETPKGAGAANTTPYVMALLGKASRDFGVVTSYQPSTSAPGDLGAYIRAGKPSIQLISSEVYYHSSGDTPSTISVPGLERAAWFFAGLIEDLDKTPREKLVPSP